MNIGGIVKTSLIDFPGRPATVIFLQGCNWRCPYCHNPDLVSLVRRPEHTLDEVFAVLDSRPRGARNVVVTGGEPTRQPMLIQFLQECRRRGLSIKLDTNGGNPAALDEIINADLADYIAMDVKGPLGRYPRYCGRRTQPAGIARSIHLLRKSHIEYEFRTTVVPALHHAEDFKVIGQWLAGGKRLFLQPFVTSTQVLRPNIVAGGTPSPKFLEDCAGFANQWLPTQIRN